MLKAVYPGTFDPITNGHVDVIERAASLFDEVIVAVAKVSGKKPLLSLEERLNITQVALEKISNVSVISFDGLLVNFVHQVNASTVIRGLRAVSDFDYEFQLAGMNRKLAPNIETLFLMASENHAYLSSTLVREIKTLGGDISQFVPKAVAEKLLER